MRKFALEVDVAMVESKTVRFRCELSKDELQRALLEANNDAIDPNAAEHLMNYLEGGPDSTFAKLRYTKKEVDQLVWSLGPSVQDGTIDSIYIEELDCEIVDSEVVEGSEQASVVRVD